jgi:hypothetical protein
MVLPRTGFTSGIAYSSRNRMPISLDVNPSFDSWTTNDDTSPWLCESQEGASLEVGRVE